MPIKRRRAKEREHRITPEVIAAWEAADFSALHAALDLKPWEASPLPREITALGVSQSDVADPTRWADLWNESITQAVELQRQLLKLAGWPDCREEYEKNLRDAEQRLAY